jgi:hypothetical protein
MSTTVIHCISIDGVDKKNHERLTETMNQDEKNYSKKHSHGALKYQLVLSAQQQQCVHIFGPVRGGMHDKEMLSCSGILDRLQPGKLANVDRGYIKYQWKDQLAWPSYYDDKPTNNMKSRICLCHESFNGKMCYYRSMNVEWNHSDEQHGLAFRAVAVNIQYGLNDGLWNLFDP